MHRLLYMAMVLMSGCASATGEQQLATAIAPETSSARVDGESISHYLSATILQYRGQYDESAEQMRKAAEKAPNPLPLRKKLVAMYIRSGNMDRAIEECETAIRQLPDDPSLHIILGTLYQQTERFEEATRTFEKAIALTPGNTTGYEALVRAAESANDLVSVVDTYRRLLELSPQSSDLQARYGIALARLNDYEAASAALQKAIELDPNNLEALYILGLVSLDADKNEQAVVYLRRLQELKPDYEKLDIRLTGALARNGQDAEALEILRKVIDSGRGSQEMTVQAMYLMLRLQRYDEVLNTATPTDAPVFSAVLRAIAKLQSGKEGAATEFDGLSTTDSDFDEETGRFLSGLINLSPGKTGEDALSQMLGALRTSGVASKWLDVLYGRVLMARDNYAQAEPVLQGVLTTYGADRNAHLALATLYQELDRPEDCERHLQAYLELDPNDPEVLNFLGYLYADMGKNLDRAEELVRKALEAEPENGFFLDSLGWVFYRKGNADEAIRYIRMAIIRMSEDDAELRSHLGDAYLLKGDKERAVSEWKRAYRLDPTLKGLQEKLNEHDKSAPQGKTT